MQTDRLIERNECLWEKKKKQWRQTIDGEQETQKAVLFNGIWHFGDGLQKRKIAFVSYDLENTLCMTFAYRVDTTSVHVPTQIVGNILTDAAIIQDVENN